MAAICGILLLSEQSHDHFNARLQRCHHQWYAELKLTAPGDFKRTKKFKNTPGEWVRIFEHKASDTLLKITEKVGYLDICFANDLVGKGYLFRFDQEEASNFDDGAICFFVVEQSYYEKNGHFDSVHFTDTHDMPEHFDEVMESCFVVEERTEEIRKELLELGFTELKE
jgi:hypothetical protein